MRDKKLEVTGFQKTCAFEKTVMKNWFLFLKKKPRFYLPINLRRNFLEQR